MIRYGLIALCALIAVSCGRRPDSDALRAEILELHRSFIQAHLDGNAAYISGFTAPEYVAVSDGRVEAIDAGAMESMLSAYLDSTVFSRYEDVADPMVGVSDDGSLAWSIVRVRVAGARTAAGGPPREFDTLWAWMTLYRREDGRWLRMADVSTRRPYDGGP